MKLNSTYRRYGKITTSFFKGIWMGVQDKNLLMNFPKEINSIAKGARAERSETAIHWMLRRGERSEANEHPGYWTKKDPNPDEVKVKMRSREWAPETFFGSNREGIAGARCSSI